jgi:hypothetical protein
VGVSSRPWGSAPLLPWHRRRELIRIQPESLSDDRSITRKAAPRGNITKEKRQ